MNSKIILHLCADMGTDSVSYQEAGYDVRLIGRSIGIEGYHPPENVYGIIANPPCTMFSTARTNAKTPRDTKEGMRLVKECLRVVWECQYKNVSKHIPYKLKFWVIENPQTGYLKHFLGNPIYTYSPHEFGHNFTKKTALWGYFNPPTKTTPFSKPPKGKTITDIITPMTHRDRHERMNARSVCCEGFEKAFFKANR